MLEMEICDCLMFHILYSLRVFLLNSSFLIKANNTSPFIEGEMATPCNVLAGGILRGVAPVGVGALFDSDTN